MENLSWDKYRCELAIEHLVKEGMTWVDEQEPQTQYWFPGLFQNMQDIDSAN